MLVHVAGFDDQGRPLGTEEGTLAEYDASAQRWLVLMSDGSGKSVKPEDLSPLVGISPAGGAGSSNPEAVASPSTASAAFHPGDRVRIAGLRSRADLNGQSGEIVEFVVADGRWRVWMDDGTGKSLKPEHLEIVEVATRAEPAPGDNNDRQAPFVGPPAIDAEIMPGARVRVRGLAVRSDLNGQEGVVRGFDEAAGRWVVEVDDGTCKFRTVNLEVVSQAPRLEASPPRLVARLATLSSADAVLALCAEERDALTIADVAEALRKMTRCPDHGVRRADARLLALLAHLRVELLARAVPQDVVVLLDAFREFDLQSLPLLQAVGNCMSPQVRLFDTEALVRALAAFAALGHAPAGLFDTLAEEIRRRTSQLTGTDILCVVSSFARVRLRHFEALDDLAQSVVPLLASFDNDELALLATAFADLDALAGVLLQAVAEAVTCRAKELRLSHVARLASALARQGAPAMVEQALKKLAQIAAMLFESGDDDDLLAPHELAALLDALPKDCPPVLLQRLGGPIQTRAREIGRCVASLCSCAGGACVCNDAAAAELRGIFENNPGSVLGLVGAQWVLDGMGISRADPAFILRALNRISWASSCVEDWSVRTSPVRSFVCAEWRRPATQPGAATEAADGYCVRHGPDADASVPGFLSDAFDRRLLLNGEMCAFCQVLCDLAACFQEPQRAGASAELFVPSPLGFVGFLSLACFRAALPEVKLAIAIGTECNFPSPVVSRKGHDRETNPEMLHITPQYAEEVIDFDLPCQEAMEIVD